MAEMSAACDAGDKVACDNLSREEEAKRAWLAKQSTPPWGVAATAHASGASEAPPMAETQAACSAGDMAACDSLSREEEAKRAWLAKQVVPVDLMLKLQSAALHTEVAVRRAVEQTQAPRGSFGSAEFRRSARQNGCDVVESTLREKPRALPVIGFGSAEDRRRRRAACVAGEEQVAPRPAQPPMYSPYYGQY
jgi:hypothetical protein